MRVDVGVISSPSTVPSQLLPKEGARSTSQRVVLLEQRTRLIRQRLEVAGERVGIDEYLVVGGHGQVLDALDERLERGFAAEAVQRLGNQEASLPGGNQRPLLISRQKLERVSITPQRLVCSESGTVYIEAEGEEAEPRTTG